jgi:hypothetical protein
MKFKIEGAYAPMFQSFLYRVRLDYLNLRISHFSVAVDLYTNSWVEVDSVRTFKMSLRFHQAGKMKQNNGRSLDVG